MAKTPLTIDPNNWLRIITTAYLLCTIGAKTSRRCGRLSDDSGSSMRMILGGGSEPTDVRGPKDFAVEQKQGSPRRGIRCWPLERFDTETKTLWVASGPEVLQLDSLGKTIGNFELFLLEGGPPLQAEGPLVDRDFIRAARPLRGTFEFMKPHGLTICKSTDHQQVKPQDTGENIARFDLPNAPGAKYFFRLWLYEDGERKMGAEPIQQRNDDIFFGLLNWLNLEGLRMI